MKVLFATIFSIIMLSFISCNNPSSEPPEVLFDTVNIPRDTIFIDSTSSDTTYLKDSENLFTKEQNIELESYLKKIKQDKNIEVHVFTVPSQIIKNKKWIVQSSYMPNGLHLTFSISMRYINISYETETDKTKIKYIQEKIVDKMIIPQFDKGDYYLGVKNGLDEIIAILEKENNK